MRSYLLNHENESEVDKGLDRHEQQRQAGDVHVPALYYTQTHKNQNSEGLSEREGLQTTTAQITVGKQSTGKRAGHSVDISILTGRFPRKLVSRVSIIET